MTVVATVGTTHPLAFAGLAFAMLALAEERIRPVCVVTGVTAQDAARVLARAPLEAQTIGAQFAALRGAGVGAFHVGALLSADVVHAVADGLSHYPHVPMVLDPVLAASGGDALADEPTRVALRERLIPRATLVTPNLDEASLLLAREVRDLEAMRRAAADFVALGAQAALVKGGHLPGAAIDVFADASGTREFLAARIAAQLRGTGDLLAVTIAGALARGARLPEAIEHARARVREGIEHGVGFAGTRVARWPQR